MLEDTFNYQPAVAQGQAPRSEPENTDQYAATVQYTTAQAGAGNGQAPPTFTTNYAMHQGIQAQQNGFPGISGDFGMYRSSYLHSHAKPPYSYISLIAMAIQVIY